MDKWLTITKENKSDSSEITVQQFDDSATINSEMSEHEVEKVDEPSTSQKRRVSSECSKNKKKYKFVDSWMKIEEFKDWLISSGGQEHEKAFCKVCQCNILAHKSILSRHAASEKHKFKMNQVKKNIKITNLFKTPTEEMAIRNAEINLCAMLTTNFLPFSLMDTLCPLIKKIFPDSKIAQNINVKRTKATALVCESLGATFLENIAQKLGQPAMFFSLIMDETTDISVKKQCAFSVIYYDFENNVIRTQFLDIIENDGGTASELFNTLKGSLTSKNIPLSNLVGFSSDTTNVMAGEHHSVFSLLKKELPNIVCIKCSCHMAHLAVSKACLVLPRSVEDLLRNLASHFNRSSQRQKKFQEFQIFFSTEIHKILSPSITRWLSIKACVDRVLEQYQPLVAYLRETLLEDPSITTEQMLTTMNNKFTKVFLEFMSYVLVMMTDFNLLFQSEKPLLHRVKPETEKLLRDLCCNFMNISVVRKDNILTLNHTNPRFFVPLDEIYLGLDAYDSFQTVQKSSDVDKKECDNFLKTILNFYIELVSNIKQRFVFDDDIYEILEIIEPQNARSFKTKSLKHVIDKFPQLKIKIPNLQDLDNEWRRHALLDFDDLNIASIDDADSYWHVIFNLKNAAGMDLFPHLKQVIALLLILPFSNASVERVFSDLFNVKNDKRNQLNTSTIRAILASKEGIKSSGGCIKFVPSTKMLNASIWKKKDSS